MEVIDRTVSGSSPTRSTTSLLRINQRQSSRVVSNRSQLWRRFGDGASYAEVGCAGSQPAISAAVALDRMRCGQAQLGFVSIIESAILVGQASWVTRSAADAARFEHGFEPRTRHDRLY